MKYVLLGDDTEGKAEAAALQKMLKDIGIQLHVEERPSSDFSKVTKDRDFDIFGMGFTMGDPFGVAYFGQIYKQDSELNKSGTGSPELDKKIDELARIPDKDKQIEEANKLEKEALSQYGLMPWANGPDMSAVREGIANFGAPSFAVLEVENIGWMKGTES